MAATTVHESDLDKAAARIGQAALFWGALQLALTALDAYTKWDMLPNVRDSLAPGLAIAVGLRPGLWMLAVASALIWASMRPKKAPALSLIDRLTEKVEDETKKEEEPPSLLRLAAVPVFLAIVCAGAFWGVEREYPHRTGAKRQASSPAPAEESKPLLDRHWLSSTEESSPPLAASDRSGNRVRAFMVSLFAALGTGNQAEPDAAAQADSGSNPAKPDHSAAPGSGARSRPGLLQRAYHAVQDTPATSNGASGPCVKGSDATGKDGGPVSSGRPCDAAAAADTSSTTVWQFNPPSASTK